MTDEPPEADLGRRMFEIRDYSYDVGLDKLFAADEDWATAYDGLAEYVLRNDDGLPRKYRELFMAGFAAVQHRPTSCTNHFSAALQRGATLEEVHQTIHLAALVGGCYTMATGAEALDDLEDVEDSYDID